MSRVEGREHPVIFTGANVLAIMAGRKTQTRRVLKPQPERFAIDYAGTLCDVGLLHVDGDPWPRVTAGRVITRQEIRFAVGQRLWVRETWADVNTDSGPALAYRAGGIRFCEEDAYPVEYDRYSGCSFCMWWGDLERGEPDHRWRSPIHMPRWASRLTLAVTDVRVERLQHISEADALAEGIDRLQFPESGDWGWPQARYRDLWNSIHGSGAWDRNPWVVAITFTRHPAPDTGRAGT